MILQGNVAQPLFPGNGWAVMSRCAIEERSGGDVVHRRSNGRQFDSTIGRVGVTKLKRRR